MDRQLSAEALRSSQREPSAFARFYREHSESLLIHITQRVFDVDTAFDLTAESFAKAYLKRRDFRGDTDAEAGAWLYSIAHREISQYFRRSAVHKRAVKRLGMQIPEITEDEEARILELAALDPLRALVRAELAKLSSSQQQALQLRVVDDLGYEEVAERLEISEQAARARVARGLRALASALDRPGSDLREGLT